MQVDTSGMAADITSGNIGGAGSKGTAGDYYTSCNNFEMTPTTHLVVTDEATMVVHTHHSGPNQQAQTQKQLRVL